MGDISQHFSKSEATCKCGCGQCIVKPNHVAILEDLRKWCNAPVMVHSWNRCKIYNKKVGGVDGSRHMFGEAADVSSAAKTPKQIYDYLNKKYGGKIGLGLYKTFVHVDVWGGNRRWVG